MEIWQEIKKDIERGAERLVSGYGNRLYAAALLLCGNCQDAEELTFRTLNQAIAKIHLFDEKRNFFTWLYSIMLNFRRMDLRKKRAKVIPVGAVTNLPELPTDEFAAKLERSGNDAIVRAIGALSPVLREVVVLRYYEEKTLEEMAEILGVPTGTVKSRLHHARASLANGYLTNERSGK